MKAPAKLVWLKRTLIVKIIIVALMWGLPSLLAPASVLKLFGGNCSGIETIAH